MSRHPTDLNGATPAEVGLALASLRYDTLAEVLRGLARQLKADSMADAARNRPQLSALLYNAHFRADHTAAEVERAWAVCRQHEEDKPAPVEEKTSLWHGDPVTPSEWQRRFANSVSRGKIPKPDEPGACGRCGRPEEPGCCAKGPPNG